MPTKKDKQDIENSIPSAMRSINLLINGLEDGKCKNTLIKLIDAMQQSKGKLSDRVVKATQDFASFLQFNPDLIYTQSLIATNKSGQDEWKQLREYSNKLEAIKTLQDWIDSLYNYHGQSIPTIKRKKKGVFGTYRTQEKITKKQPRWRYKNLVDGMSRITLYYPHGANPVFDLNFEGLNIHDIQKICYDNGFSISIDNIEDDTYYFSIPLPNHQMFRQLQKCIREYSAEKTLAKATENSPKNIDGDALKIKPHAPSNTKGVQLSQH